MKPDPTPMRGARQTRRTGDAPAHLVLFNKPFRVLSERTGEPGKPTVSDFIPLPALEPAGRLDYDSEGLVVLTNVGWLQHRIAHPGHKLPKRYWVQVEGEPSAEAIRQLSDGIVLSDGPTLPAQVKSIPPAALWPRVPPVQERNDLPSSWLEVMLSEGRKRQIRRMTAAVGHPTLRLVRVAVGPFELGDLRPGEWREISCPSDAAAFDRHVAPASPPARD